jgi:hypothetical protein
MAIVTRVGKGSKLTTEEMDNNLLSLETDISGNVSAITSKLDKGSYTGTAKDLDNAIAASVTLIASKLDKGSYTGTAKDLENAIIAAVTGASGISIVPTSPVPAGTGIASFTATQAGTYTNYGGVVVAANSFAVISRSATGVFSISQTALDLTTYAKTVDVAKKANLALGKNLFNYQDTDVLLNSSFGGGGTTVYVTANVVISGFIVVTAGQTYSCNKTNGGYADNYYNANKVYLSSSTGSGGLATAPAGAFYIRKVFVLGTISTTQEIQIESGNVITIFENYKYAVPISELANAALLADFKVEQYYKNKKAEKSFGKNLFNKNATDIIFGKFLGGAGDLQTSVTYNISGYIPVLPNTQYTFSGNSLGGAQCCYYNIDKQFISSFSTATFTVSTNTYYIRISFGANTLNLTQVELGSVVTSYKEYTENKTLEDALVTSEGKIDGKISINNNLFLNKNANLFDETKVTTTAFIGGGGNVTIATGTVYACSDFIPLEAGQAVFISGYFNDGNFSLCFYNADKIFISAIPQNAISTGVTGVTNCKFFRYNFNSVNLGFNVLQAEYGTSRTAYKPFGFTLKKEYVEYTNGENLIDSTKFWNGSLSPTGDLINSNIANASRTSELIKVNPSDKIFTNNIFNFDLAEYDVNHKFIKIYYGTVGISTPYVIGTNTVYFRVATSTALWENKLMFRISDVPIPADYYVPYQKSAEYVKELPMTQDIAMPKKIWGFNNEKLVLYTNAIKKRYVNDRFTLIIRQSLYSLLNNKINIGSCSTFSNLTSSMTIETVLFSSDFDPKKILTSTLVPASLTTNNGTVVINPIGDSITDINTQYKWIKDNCPAVTFVGARYNSNTLLEHDGGSGWTLKQFVTQVKSPNEWAGYSEFMHPTDLTLKYYGCTKLWIAEYTGGVNQSSMKRKGDSVGGFSPTTGFRLTPLVDDVQYVFSETVFKKYDGTAWVTIANPTFTFNYSKFLSVWNITQPTHVPIMLGTNDYSRVTELGAIARFNADFVTDMNTVVASIRQVSSEIKIGVIIPPLRATPDTEDASWNTPTNACMWQERKTIIDTYDNREVEKIYVIDNGTAVDPITNFGTLGVNIADSTHPNSSGFTNMGKRIGAWIQVNR